MSTTPNSLVTHTDDARFQSEVLKATELTLVDFWAPWCGPCRAIAPLLEELATEFAGKVKITKINTDESQQVASQFGIQSIPTLLLFKNGQVVDQLVGAVPRTRLVDMFNKHLAK